MTGEHESRSSVVDTSTLDYLRVGGVEAEYAAGDVIVRRGEPGRALYVVLAGEVEVRLGRAARHLTLCRMGPGSTFGEVSLLRGVPTTADVVANSPATVLEYPAELFPQALAERESLMHKIMTRMARNLQSTTDDAWELFSRTEALRALVRHHGAGERMVAVTARSRALVAALQARAASAEPVLLYGEPGTGKLLAARTLHDASAAAEGSFVVVHCDRLAPDAAAALLGDAGGSDLSEPLALKVAPGGTLVLAGLESLPHPVQSALAFFLARLRRCAAAEGATRVLATAREPERLIPQLADCFSEPIELPPLRQRPREIVPLARHFLAQAGAAIGRPRRFATDAERVLVSLGYRCRNVAELRDIVELAARCAEAAEVRAEHVVAGIAPDEEPVGAAAAAGGALDAVLRGRAPAVARWVVLGGFLAVIVLGLTAAGSAAARTTNAALWSIWEPVVFALFLVAGPIWCTVCPLSSAGRSVQRLVCLERPLPPRLKRYGVWLGAAGLLFILWVERAAGMADAPAASALLLLGLLAAAVGFCIVFRREVWCRYVCPLGYLAVAAAPAAPLTVAAQRRVCSSGCTTHECYRGTVGTPGCTVFHHPQLASQSHHCKLCLDCLRTCPHRATALYLRPPLRGASGLVTADTYVVPFALSVLFLAPVFLAAERGGALGRPGWLSAAGLAALGAAALMTWLLPWILHGRTDADSPAVPQVALALAILGWGPLLAFQLGHVGVLASVRLAVDPGASALLGTLSGLDLQTAARVAVVLATGLPAALVLRRARRTAGAVHAGRWRALLAAVAAYLVLAVLLAI